MKTTRFVKMSLVLAAAVTAGCRPWDFKATEPPTEAFRAYPRVVVQPFLIETSDSNQSVREKGLAVARAATTELVGWLKDSNLFGDSGPALVIQGRILGYDEGDQGARFLIGFGAGKGQITAEVTLKDESGRLLARGIAVGDVTGGLIGGNIDVAARYLARGIMEFIRENHGVLSAGGR